MANNHRRASRKPEATTTPATASKPAAPKRQPKTAASLLDHLRSTKTGKLKIEAGAGWLAEHGGASAGELLAAMRDKWPGGTCLKAESFIGTEVVTAAD